MDIWSLVQSPCLESLRSAGASREVTLSEVRTAVLPVRATHRVSAQGTAAPVPVLEVAAGLVIRASERVVRAKLLVRISSFVETQPELARLASSGLCWGRGEFWQEKLIAAGETPGGRHVTLHAGGAAVHLVLAAGGLGIWAAPNTCSRPPSWMTEK